jgi:hypothetical protein
MITGCLLGESVRVGAALVGVPLRIREVRRARVTEPGDEQPDTWTHILFEADDDAAKPLADALAACLEPQGGWYCDFSTGTEKFVVFAGRVFRYPRGDAAGRAEAAAYGRSVGVPEPQLDWSD